jgi:hypothetical protein
MIFGQVRVATLAVSLAGFLWAGAADASTVALTSQSAFSSSTTGVVNGNFDSVPTPFGTPPSTFGGYNPLSGYSGLLGVSFGTPNSGGNVNVNSASFYGSTDLPAPYAVNSTYTGTAADILTITLPSPETAFYLDFTTLFSSTTATFSLSNGFTTTVSPTVTLGTTPTFLGFVSNVPFTTITLSVPNGQSWVVADFGVGSWNGVSPIPEPSTWVMLLLGFVGLGWAGYRQRRKLAGALSV